MLSKRIRWQPVPLRACRRCRDHHGIFSRPIPRQQSFKSPPLHFLTPALKFSSRAVTTFRMCQARALRSPDRACNRLSLERPNLRATWVSPGHVRMSPRPLQMKAGKYTHNKRHSSMQGFQNRPPYPPVFGDARKRRYRLVRIFIRSPPSVVCQKEGFIQFVLWL